MSKVFISHCWEDNDVSKKVAEYLKRDGTEIWIDYARIEGGDRLPEKISEALKWCDTLVLIWSKTASESFWIKEEWTNALTLRKKIIPCILESTKLPEILSSRLYIDLREFNTGYKHLCKALGLKGAPEIKKIESFKKTKSPFRPFIILSFAENRNKFIIKNVGNHLALKVKVEDVPIIEGKEYFLSYTFHEINVIQPGEERELSVYLKDARGTKEADSSFDLGALIPRSAERTHSLLIRYTNIDREEFQTKGKWGKGGIVIS